MRALGPSLETVDLECDVMEGEFVQVNPIIDTNPAQGGKVSNEVPLTWLASSSFRNNPKLLT